MSAKKILAMPDGNWLAHVSRPFEVSKALREMGHEVLFAGEGEYMKFPRKAGFPTLPIKTIEPDRVLECARKGRTNAYDRNLLKECVKEDLKLFDKIMPDLVLGDLRASLGISCRVSKVPLAITTNAAWTNYSSVKIRSIEHSGIGRLEKKILGRRLSAWLGIPDRVKKLITSIDGSPYRKLRKEMGLAPCRNICDAMEGDLNLLCDIPEYAPTHNLPPNFHYVGPILWEPDVEPPSWLDNLSPERPTLYFTMGSTGHPRFFQKAIEIFGNTEYQCLVTTAGMADIKNAPENFFITDYAPGNKIMEKSNVVICHGGNGTLYQAMSRGVPIIGIPTLWDQELNLQRVVDLGIGVQLTELKFKPSHLVKAVEKILTGKSYRENVQKFKRMLANYNGAGKGAELIHSYLDGSPKTTFQKAGAFKQGIVEQRPRTRQRKMSRNKL